MDPCLAPFYHGVASGDPLSDAVIIWTRITTQDLSSDVDWQVATDLGFTNVVQSGTFTTDASLDYTVKVDVTGLTAATTYYYRFLNGAAISIIGRTKTAPTGSTNNLRFAVGACSSFATGYFNVYKEIGKRNDIDAVIHLGDYIYEDGDTDPPGRPHDPPYEIITLDDYRARYSTYRLDADLRYAHQQHPFINVWDDHESVNNSWRDGASNHNDATEGLWEVRKANAAQAYYEWVPIRQPDLADAVRIYRTISYGDLLNLYMIDTRLYGRSEQGVGAAEDRTILGQQQMTWLLNEMGNSTAQYNIIGQQVVFTEIPGVGSQIPIVFPDGNEDSWFGYPTDRDTIIDFVEQNNISNFVVLTGDVHTAWVSDIVGTSGYTNGNPPTGSSGVEFVCNSITRESSPIPIPLSTIQNIASNVKYAELVRKGYVLLDIRADKVQADYYSVDNIADTNYTITYDASHYMDNGTSYSQEGNAEAASLNLPATPAPACGVVSSVQESVLVVGSYPNPFADQILLQYFVDDINPVMVSLFDMSGKQVWSEEIRPAIAGVNFKELRPTGLVAGSYMLILDQDGAKYQRHVQHLGNQFSSFIKQLLSF